MLDFAYMHMAATQTGDLRTFRRLLSLVLPLRR
jgi:hypothetical protein